jgi:hypothetical protein
MDGEKEVAVVAVGYLGALLQTYESITVAGHHHLYTP